MEVNDDLSNLLLPADNEFSAASRQAPSGEPNDSPRMQANAVLDSVQADDADLLGMVSGDLGGSKASPRRVVPIKLPDSIELTADGARSSLSKSLTMEQRALASKHNVSFVAVKGGSTGVSAVPMPPKPTRTRSAHAVGDGGASRAARAAARLKASEDTAVAGLLSASASKRSEENARGSPSPPAPPSNTKSRFPPLQTVGEDGKRQGGVLVRKTSGGSRPPAPPRSPRTPRAPTTPRRRPNLNALVVPDGEVGDPLIQTPAIGDPFSPDSASPGK